MCGFQFVDIAVNQSRIDDLFKIVLMVCRSSVSSSGSGWVEKMSVLVIPEQWVRLCFMV